MRAFVRLPLIISICLLSLVFIACGGGGGDGDTSDTYFADADGDGFGDAGNSQVLDSAQAGWVLDSTDCDDTVGSGASIFPGASEVCDGVDNDCNGATADGADEGALGDPCDGADSDQCNEGNEECSGGVMVCSDLSGDDVETCNNVDDDCDGETDEASSGVPLTQVCYTGPLATRNVGLCSDGTQTCGSGSWGSCVGEVLPSTDTCDDNDNDCDGTVDEDFLAGGSVTYTDWDFSELVKGDSCGTGACAGGTVICGVDQTSLQCTTEVNASAEICNGLDDDCNEVIDDGIFCPASGILDDSFGGDVNPSDGTPDGFVIFTVSNNDYGFGVLPGTDGTIYVAGSYDGNQNDMALWRYTSSGVLDTTFSSDGLAVYDRGSYDTGWAAALDVSGHIYLAGHTHGGASNYDMTLLRYNDAGVLDTGFGTGGVVTHNGAAGGANGNDHGLAVTLDPDGRIYVAGHSQDGGGVEYMTLWRYTSSGVLDTTFGGDINPADGTPDGFAIYNGGSGNHRGQAVAFDAVTGRVYTAGYGIPSSQDLVLLCFDSAGVLDTTFDGDGILIHDGATTGDDAAGLGVTLDLAGRIYVAGENQSDSVIWRFNTDGVLDTTFGGDTSPADGTPDGFVLHDNAAGGNGIDAARAIALDASGLIYVAGNSQGANEDMVLWRYTSSGVLDTTFGADVNPADGTPDGFVVQAGTAGGNGVDRGTSVAVGTVDIEKVYVTGYSHNGANFDMVLWRFR